MFKVKKIFFSIITILLIFSLSGCSKSDSKKNEPSKPVKKETENDSKKNDIDVHTKFEKGLDELGIDYEIKDVDYTMIGASSGKRYVYNSGTNSIELYEFKDENETYQKVVSSGMLTVGDFGDFPARANNGLVLTLVDLSRDIKMFSDTVEHKDEIIKLFLSLKK